MLDIGRITDEQRLHRRRAVCSAQRAFERWSGKNVQPILEKRAHEFGDLCGADAELLRDGLGWLALCPIQQCTRAAACRVVGIVKERVKKKALMLGEGVFARYHGTGFEG